MKLSVPIASGILVVCALIAAWYLLQPGDLQTNHEDAEAGFGRRSVSFPEQDKKVIRGGANQSSGQKGAGQDHGSKHVSAMSASERRVRNLDSRESEKARQQESSSGRGGTVLITEPDSSLAFDEYTVSAIASGSPFSILSWAEGAIGLESESGPIAVRGGKTFTAASNVGKAFVPHIGSDRIAVICLSKAGRIRLIEECPSARPGEEAKRVHFGWDETRPSVVYGKVAGQDQSLWKSGQVLLELTAPWEGRIAPVARWLRGARLHAALDTEGEYRFESLPQGIHFSVSLQVNGRSIARRSDLLLNRSQLRVDFAAPEIQDIRLIVMFGDDVVQGARIKAFPVKESPEDYDAQRGRWPAIGLTGEDGEAIFKVSKSRDKLRVGIEWIGSGGLTNRVSRIAHAGDPPPPTSIIDEVTALAYVMLKKSWVEIGVESNAAYVIDLRECLARMSPQEMAKWSARLSRAAQADSGIMSVPGPLMKAAESGNVTQVFELVVKAVSQ